MPPLNKGSLDDSDRTDLTSSRDSSAVVRFENAVQSSPTRPAPVKQRSSHRIEVPRSTTKEIESKRVSRITSDLPGFTDWRTNVAEKKGQRRRQEENDDDINGKGGTFASRRRERRARRYRQVQSTSAAFLDSRLTSSDNIIVTDEPEDEALSRHHSCPEPQTTSTTKQIRTKKTVQDYNTRKSTATEATSKHSNTTRATMDKYKRLYEAMLKDIGKDEGDTAWIGLGDVEENAVVARDAYGSLAKRHVGLSRKGSSSFHGSGTVNDNEAGLTREGLAKKSRSFRSAVKDNEDGPRREGLARKSRPFHVRERSFRSANTDCGNRSFEDNGREMDGDDEYSSTEEETCDKLADDKSFDTGATWVAPKKKASVQKRKETSFHSTQTSGSSSIVESRVDPSENKEGCHESQGPSSQDGGKTSTGVLSPRMAYQTKKSSSFHGTTGRTTDRRTQSKKSSSFHGLKSSIRSASSSSTSKSPGEAKVRFDDSVEDHAPPIDNEKMEDITKEVSSNSINSGADRGSSTSKRPEEDESKSSSRDNLLPTDETVDGLDVDEVRIDVVDEPLSKDFRAGDSIDESLVALASEADGVEDVDNVLTANKVAESMDGGCHEARKAKIAVVDDTTDPEGSDYEDKSVVKYPRNPSKTNHVDKSSEEKSHGPCGDKGRAQSVRFDDCNVEMQPFSTSRDCAAKKNKVKNDKDFEQMAQKLALVPARSRKKRSEHEGNGHTAVRRNPVEEYSTNPCEMALVPTRRRKKRPENSSRCLGHSSKSRDNDLGVNHNRDSKSERRRHHKPRRDRSPSPSDARRGNRRDRDDSRSLSPDSSVDSQRSNTSGQSSRSGYSRSRSRSRSGLRLRLPSPFSRSLRSVGDDASEGQPKTSDNAADDAAYGVVNAGQKKKGLFRKIKKLAGKVKDTLGELGGVTGVHRYQPGEWARYRVAKPPRCLKSFDHETMTVAVRILEVQTDAVLEMPYYTIGLPDGTSKQTNWDNLISMSQYKKILAGVCEDESPYAPDAEDEKVPSRWFRPLSRGRSSSRGKGQERSRSRQGSRACSSSRGEEDDKSTASQKSSRSGTSHKSSRSSSSRHSSSRDRRPRGRSPSLECEERDHPHSSRNGRLAQHKERSPSPGTTDARSVKRRSHRRGSNKVHSLSVNSSLPENDAQTRRHKRNEHPSSMKSTRSGEGSLEEKQPRGSDRWKHHRSPSKLLNDFESSTRSGGSRRSFIQEEDF